MNIFNKTMIESNLNRVYQHLINSSAIVSPYRSEYTDSENRGRMSRLKADVRKLGYGFIEFKARWAEKDENGNIIISDEYSLLIPKISKDEAMRLGADYEQSSIIYSDGASCEEICTTPFVSWDDKEYNKGDVVRTFNINSNTPLNVELAKDIFANRKVGAASQLVKGKREFTLSEVYEVEANNASTFSNKEKLRLLFKC